MQRCGFGGAEVWIGEASAEEEKERDGVYVGIRYVGQGSKLEGGHEREIVR